MNLREQQRAQTRQRFIDTALRLFREHGFQATSMNQIANGYRSLDELPDHDLPSIRQWLVDSHTLWSRHHHEFSAMEQAMAADEAVADERLGMLQRASRSLHRLYERCTTADERERTEVHLVTLMMSMDRNFCSLYVRGHRDREELVLDALARQWAVLYAGE